MTRHRKSPLTRLLSVGGAIPAGLVFATVFALAPATARAAEAVAAAVEVTVDFARPAGRVRPLHGGNDGPIQFGGLVDLSEQHRAIALPLTRLHDCRWPNPDDVDMHAVLPNPAADPASPASFDFAATDECVATVLRAE